MSDLHGRFAAWLTDGARADLPRDAALHASACDACLRDAAAFDALLAIDPGAAALPPLRAADAPRLAPRLGMLRAGVGVAAVLLLAVSVGIGAGGLLDQRAELTLPAVSPTPDGEGILGGGGGPAATTTATAEPSDSADPSASAEPSDDDPEPTPTIGLATAGPAATPRPSTIITPPAGTPRPSGSSVATPAPTAPPSLPPIATPTPTPALTPIPTPIPTPEPTPIPTPQCSDGIDNDSDGLIDFGLDPLVNDPGCLSPDDDDESTL